MYYTYYFIGLTSTRKRAAIKDKNVRLDMLRDKPLKSISEQKEFISLKYPRKPKYVFRWRDIGMGFVYAAVGISLYIAYSKLLLLLGLDISLFWAMTIIIIVPIVVNYFLMKTHLETDSVLVYIKGKR